MQAGVLSIMLQQNNLQEAQWWRAAVHAWWQQTSLSCFPPSLSLSLTGYVPEFGGPACKWASEEHEFLYSRRRGSARHLPGNQVSLGIHSGQKPRFAHSDLAGSVVICTGGKNSPLRGSEINFNFLYLGTQVSTWKKQEKIPSLKHILRGYPKIGINKISIPRE